MATISITSNDGDLDSASAVLEVSATNPEYNQPALRIKQAGKRGGAASIRIDDPNPDIEFVETGLPGTDPNAGKFEIAVQADQLQINGRKADVGSQKGFETIVVFHATGSGWQYRFRIPGSPLQKVWKRKGCYRDRECLGRSFGEYRRRWDCVCRGRGTQVSRLERHGDSDRARLGGPSWKMSKDENKRRSSKNVFFRAGTLVSSSGPSARVLLRQTR